MADVNTLAVLAAAIAVFVIGFTYRDGLERL